MEPLNVAPRELAGARLQKEDRLRIAGKHLRVRRIDVMEKLALGLVGEPGNCIGEIGVLAIADDPDRYPRCHLAASSLCSNSCTADSTSDDDSAARRASRKPGAEINRLRRA